MRTAKRIAWGIIGGMLLAELALRAGAPLAPLPLKAFLQEEGPRSTLSVLRVARGTTLTLPEGAFQTAADGVAVGDSMVFGTLVSDSELFTSRIQERTGRRVLNLGVGGRGPCAYNRMLALAADRLPAPPPRILYGLFANDFIEKPCEEENLGGLFLWKEAVSKDPALRLRRIREKVLGKSLLYLLIKRWGTFGHLTAGETFDPIPSRERGNAFLFAPPAYWEPKLNPARPEVTEGFLRTLEKITEARQAVETAGGRFLLLLIPCKEQVYLPRLVETGHLPQSAYPAWYDTLYDRLVIWAAAEGIPAVDLRPPFRAAAAGEKLYWTLDGHWTPAGHRLAAARLARYFEEEP